jgi:hypothetical protein
MPEKFDRVLMEFCEKEKIWNFDRTFMENKKTKFRYLWRFDRVLIEFLREKNIADFRM